MPYVNSIDRHQMQFSSLDMLVDPKSIARIIDAFVESLDLEVLGFQRHAPAVEGRPAYDPKSLLKLYIYGYRKMIRSSRRLEEACCVNIEVIWLVGGIRPDFRTISDFRKDNCGCLKSVFLEFNKRFSDIMNGYLSVDGTKIAACNSKEGNFTSSKLDDRIRWLENHISEYIRQMDLLDSEEELSGTLTADQLTEKIRESSERLERYKLYRKYMEEQNLSQISLNDADARLMKSRNGFVVSHNVQTAVDSNTHMISDYSVSSSPSDYGQLEPTLRGLKEASPGKVIEATADRGYQSEEDMGKCLENGIIPHVITADGKDTHTVTLPYEPCDDLSPESTDPAQLSRCLRAGVIPDAYRSCIDSIKTGTQEVRVDDGAPVTSPFRNEEEMLEKAAGGYFVRDPERNLVYCPGGSTLRQNYVTKKGRIRYINKMACRNCRYRNMCYRGGKGYKEVEFNKDEFVKPNGNWKRSIGEKPVFTKSRVKRETRQVVHIVLRPDRQKTDNRKCLSEHPFGTIKRAQGSDHFLLCGNRKVTGEFGISALAYNIQRALSLLGFNEVMLRMAAPMA